MVVFALFIANTSCSLFSNQDKNEEKGTEEDTEDENVPKSLEDLKGNCYFYSDWLGNTYLYVRDNNSLIFCQEKEDGRWFEDTYYDDDKKYVEIDEHGCFYTEFSGAKEAIKVVDGKLINYRSQYYDDEDVKAAEKEDKTEGLYGTWVFWDKTAEHSNPDIYVITKDKIKHGHFKNSYNTDFSNIYYEDESGSSYTITKHGLIYVNNSLYAYYDGKYLHTYGIAELTKITDETTITKIKNFITTGNPDGTESEDSEYLD